MLECDYQILIDKQKESDEVGRAEMRRMKKEQENDPVLTIRQSQLRQMVIEASEEMREQLVYDTTEMVTSLFMVYCLKVLHDDFSFGKKRLTRFQESVNELADHVIAGSETNGCDNSDIVHVVEDVGMEVNDFLKAEMKYQEMGLKRRLRESRVIAE